VHIEIDTWEIILIITWWVLSKWLARFVVLGLITKVVSLFKAKVEKKIENVKSDFTGNKEE
jgi:hypothetical protein